MINPIVLGAGGFFGKEGAVRGVAPRSKQVYGKYEAQPSISLLECIDSVEVLSLLFFWLGPKEPKGQDASKLQPSHQPHPRAASLLPAL